MANPRPHSFPRRLAQYEALLRRAAAEWIARASSGPVPPAAAALLDNLSLLQGHLHEAHEALSPGYCRKLARAARPAPTPGPYALLETGFRGPGATLDAASLLACLEPGADALTLAEVWAVEPLLKLVLLERVFDVLASGSLDDPEAAGVVQSTVRDLHAAERLPWPNLVEAISSTDRMLRRDPAGIYPRMEFDSRDLYRKAVEAIAASCPHGEEHVARTAVRLAGEQPFGSRESHVGYYLVDRGVSRLRKRAGCRISPAATARRIIARFAAFFFVSCVAFLTAASLAAVHALWPALPRWWLALIALPASQVAVSLANLLSALAIAPRRLPRLDFSDGIPEECATFVVVPTLLLSRSGVEHLLERLEIHYLANRDRHLYFALLTDYADSSSPTEVPSHLLVACAEGIRRLNARYAEGGREPFYLFHRAQEFNAAEGVWMGRERKRGKLEDFNAFLLGRSDPFEFKSGDLRALPPIRYVITLDGDTQLPLASARKLVATLAHPLHRPVLDPATGIVRDGYALLQPRVGISMESANRSLLALLYSGETGLDPYTKAVSDTYQDLFGRATYTGKGLYDVRAFVEVLDARFPANSLLSHDLIEGEHLRTGLAGDVELIDDYPATYDAWSRRKHRWTRGDWQILYWLLPRVPLAGWRWTRNPLPAASRWKILDNLRRSLVEPALALALACAWFFARHAAAQAVASAVCLLLAPAWADFAAGLLRLPPARFWRSYFRSRLTQLARGQAVALLELALALDQGFLLADAIVRAVVRRFFTGRLLLEWQSMAQVESAGGFRWSVTAGYLFGSAALALLGMLAGVAWRGGTAAASVAALWVLAPLVATLLDERPPHLFHPTRDHTRFLREAALLTWRFFDEHSTPQNHWLVPDNIQEDPPAVARRTSPTNFGLQLTAQLAAFDFGYLTAGEFVERSNLLLRTLESLPRDHGHFYNWYDTGALAPLEPRFVSTVDSGNLAAALLTAKQAFLSLDAQPLIRANILDGLRDHLLHLRNALPAPARSATLMRLIDAFLRQLDYRPAGLFSWEGLLTDAVSLAGQVSQHIGWYEPRANPDTAAALRYWRAALVRRAETALAQLRSLAPWLDEPFEDELRACSYSPAFARLSSLIESIPALAQLPDRYASIDAEIEALLQAPAPLPMRFGAVLSRLRVELALARSRLHALLRTASHQAELCHSLAFGMEFAFLLDDARQLLRVGYDSAGARLSPSCYDLLASEARTAVFFAIAKGDIPIEAWFKLGRKLVPAEGARTLQSWSGTMFEYLMPLLFTGNYPGTLLGESCAAMIRVQRRYARRRGTPWGISESAHPGRDSQLNYQYKAFGVPGIAMQAQPASGIVVAPYASMLALMIEPAAAAANLRSMAGRGWLGACGFYESIAFEPRSRPVVVRSFMAHHQAMSLLALANVLLDYPMRARFHSEPSVRAAALLLQERLPSLIAAAPEDVALASRTGPSAPFAPQDSTTAELKTSRD